MNFLGNFFNTHILKNFVMLGKFFEKPGVSVLNVVKAVASNLKFITIMGGNHTEQDSEVMTLMEVGGNVTDFNFIAFIAGMVFGERSDVIEKFLEVEIGGGNFIGRNVQEFQRRE